MGLLSPEMNLAGGIGTGLTAGVDTYLKARQQNNENQRANAAMGLLSAKQGYDYDPKTGAMTVNDYGNSLKQAQTSGIALQNKQTDYDLKNLNDTHDPDSDASNAARSLGSAYMGMLKNTTAYKKNPENFSEIEDSLTGDNATANDVYTTANHPLLKAINVDANGQDKVNAQLQRIQDTISRSTDSARAKDAKTVSDLSAKMQKDLDPDAGRAGNFGTISNTYIQSQKLKKLATDANGNVANLPSAQQEELAIGMAKMLGGSAGGSDSQIKGLVPQSAQGNIQKFKTWLMNDPQGLNQQAFTEKMMSTINREADLAQQQMKDIQVGRLGAHKRLKDMDPDTYNEILGRKGIVDTYGMPGADSNNSGLMNQSPAQSSPQSAGVQQSGPGLIGPQSAPANILSPTQRAAIIQQLQQKGVEIAP